MIRIRGAWDIQELAVLKNSLDTMETAVQIQIICARCLWILAREDNPRQRCLFACSMWSPASRSLSVWRRLSALPPFRCSRL